MKKLTLQNPHYSYLEKSFKEWLDVLGYAEGTINSFPIHVREFLHYLERNDITQIASVTSQRTYSYLHYLSRRKNVRTGAGLSSNHLSKSINALNCFARYLNSTGKHVLDITPKRPESDSHERIILTVAEIKQLYEATFIAGRHNSIGMGQRDRAMIAIFYGCGLRKDEGARLNSTDIDTYKGLVFVRKGKGNKQRYVPIALKHLQDIKDYLEEGRNWFLENHARADAYKYPVKKEDTHEEAFFLNTRGQRMQSGFYRRLAVLKEKSGIEKEITPHGLRHSIATHLLQSGMDIEEIAKFLGHSSLESTQIYTHIVNKQHNNIAT